MRSRTQLRVSYQFLRVFLPALTSTVSHQITLTVVCWKCTLALAKHKRLLLPMKQGLLLIALLSNIIRRAMFRPICTSVKTSYVPGAITCSSTGIMAGGISVISMSLDGKKIFVP